MICLICLGQCLSRVVVIQHSMNLPSPSVNYFHFLVVVVPATFTMSRSLHLTVLPVLGFQNGFLLFEAKKFSYKTVMIFTSYHVSSGGLEFLGCRSFIDPICCNFCTVLSMFFRLVLANSLFSLRDQLDTWALTPQKTRGLT